MSVTIKLGRLLGIRIGIHASWAILFVLVSWSIAQQIAGVSRVTALGVGALCASLLFTSVVAHELGHAICARAYGVRTRSITLFLFGGVALLEREPSTPRAEAAIALAGPATSAILAAVAYALSFACTVSGTRFWVEDAAPIATYVALSNGVLAAFNLVPAFPMDGGRILRALLWQLRASYARATSVSAALGIGFAVVLAVTGIVMMLSTHVWEYAWYMVMGAFLMRNGTLHYRGARSLARTEERRVAIAAAGRQTTFPFVDAPLAGRIA